MPPGNNIQRMKPEEQIDRISRRFEIAVSNFGRSCIELDANEKAFQAWYASCVTQEFGLSHVYREIHLWKSELFKLAPANELTKSLEKGHELFPDVSISWFPNVDASHSSTREEKLRRAGDFLHQFSILSELKVTGSTSNPTPPRQIKIDIAKLFVFLAAHKAHSENIGETFPLRCYMVVLDNAKNDRGECRKSYSRSKIDRTLEENILHLWEVDIPKPRIILIGPGENSAKFSLLNEFRDWIYLD